MKKKFFQVGGALAYDTPSYIEREADNVLLNYLRDREYAYILKYRQVGKSSLKVRCLNILNKEGFKCVSIDLSGKGNHVKEDEWYKSILFNITKKLKLSRIELNEQWEKSKGLTIPSRFELIIDEFILEKCQDNIIIFIDEIDSLLSINSFNRDDFFALIRSFYNLRAENKKYERLTFVLLGVASPNDLMKNAKRTPFNIAKNIKIGQFTLEESYKLTNGLDYQTVYRYDIIKKVYEWTSGTSYLTQKILEHISYYPIEKIADIDNIVKKIFIEEASSEINIQNIQERILKNKTHNAQMLYMIAKILDGQSIEYDASWRTMIYLKLSGLIKVEDGILVYSNKIYKTIFNHSWLNDMIEKIDRLIAKDLQEWLVSNRKEKYLLEGERLKKVIEWVKNRDDLSGLEYTFLNESIKQRDKKELQLKIEKEKRIAQEKIAEEKKKTKENYEKIGLFSLVIIFITVYSMMINFGQSMDSKKFHSKIDNEKKDSLELKLNELVKDTNPPLEPYQEYVISKSIKDKDALKNLIKNSIRLSNKFDKKFWLSNLKIITEEQRNKLFNILKYYAYMDRGNYYASKEKLKEAIESYSIATACNYKKNHPYKKIAKLYYQLEDYNNSVKFYKKIEPLSNNEYFAIGEIYTKTEEYNKSIEYYNKILEKDDKNIKALFSLGDVYIELNQYKKAIEYYKKIIKIDFNNDQANANIANIYFIEKEYEQAIEYYQKAIDINPIINFISSRDLAFKKLKNKQNKIKKLYEKGVQSNRVGYYNDAVSYLEKAKESNPKDYKIYNALGMAYCRLAKYDKALDAMNISKSLNKTDSKVYELLGNVYYKQKSYRRAIKNYQLFIDSRPKKKGICFNLQSAYIGIFHYELIKFNKIKDKKLEKNYIDYFKDKKRFKAYYEALKIFENIYKTNKKMNILEWQKKYSNITIDNRDIDYPNKEWIDKIENKSIKNKLIEAYYKFKENIPEIKKLSFRSAIKEAKKEQKVVMIFVYASGCPLCKQFEENLKSNLKIKKIIYQNFKLVKVEKNHIPIDITLDRDILPPILIFVEPKSKKVIRIYSTIENIFDRLKLNLREDIVEWKEKGYLRQTIKEEKIEKFSRNGWVYLGSYKNKKWKKHNFEFKKNMNPNDIVDTYISSTVNVNIRVNGKSKSKKVGGLKIGDEVQVKKIREIKSDIWAKVKY